MSKQAESPIAELAGEDLSAFRFIKINGTTRELVYAVAADLGIGVTQEAVSDTYSVSVREVHNGGTFKVEAAGAFAIGDYLYHAADGKVSAVPAGPRIGRALEAATASGDIVEIIYQVSMMEWLGRTFEAVADDKTLDIEDAGKVFYVTVDAKTVTLPAIAAGLGPIWIVNGAANGTVAVNVSPNANDKIMGADVAGTDNKDQINTKATAIRGDYICIEEANADGWKIIDKMGTWAEEG